MRGWTKATAYLSTELERDDGTRIEVCVGIELNYHPGAPEVRGDPGYPADPPELEIIEHSIEEAHGCEAPFSPVTLTDAERAEIVKWLETDDALDRLHEYMEYND